VALFLCAVIVEKVHLANTFKHFFTFLPVKCAAYSDDILTDDLCNDLNLSPRCINYFFEEHLFHMTAAFAFLQHPPNNLKSRLKNKEKILGFR
jgi:hypothetical protein